jgi:hypothetical protein
MEPEALLVDIQTNVAAFLAALEAVTDLGCVKATILIPATSPEWAETALSSVDRGGTFSGWVDEGMKKASLKIPGIKLSLVAADGSIADAGVTATLLDEFETAADFNLSDGEQIESWIRGTLDR